MNAKEITAEKCTGCTACFNICPAHAISMKYDEYGFLNPVIDNAICIDCRKCVTSCPLNVSVISSTDCNSAYAAWNKDEEILLRSSSGGVFFALAQYIIDCGGVIVGASYTTDFEVEHIIINNNSQIEKLMGSKYVQSNMGNVLSIVKELLRNGKTVLFSGSPCQIAGLKSFLGKNYSNLFTVDFICHGVPSPQIWKRYISELEEKNKSKIKTISFRDKGNGWIDFGTRIEFENSIIECVPHYEDTFTKGFLRNMYLRPSCYSCKIKKLGIQSDLRISDYWGANDTLKKLNDNKGISLVIASTEKGKKLFSEVKENLIIFGLDWEEALINNSVNSESVEPHWGRDKFYRLYKKKSQGSISEVIEKSFQATIFDRIIRKLKNI